MATDVGALPAASIVTPEHGWLYRHRAALLLVGASILIPELLTGSTPVANLLNPVAVLFLVGLYGGGVLTVREVAVRWGRGWGPILALGGAYGIAEEALGTKTYFDPTLAHNTYPAPWGHWLGVNWDWSVQLTIFHAVFSIALPILLVGLVYADTPGRRLLSDRALRWVATGYVLTVVAMFALFNRAYPVNPALFAAALGAIGVLAFVAWRMPSRWFVPATEVPDRPPRAFAWAGGAYVFLSFGISFLFGTATGNVLATAVAQVALGAIGLWWLLHHVGRSANRPHLAQLAAGLLSFLVLFGVVEEFVGDAGAFLAVAAALGLVWQAHRAAARPEPQRRPTLAPPPGAVG